jgi:methionyl-tRNA formyltransferase
LRIVLIGQASFGAKTLQALLERGEQVVGVYAPPAESAGKSDPLKQLAQEQHIPLFQPGRMRDTNVYQSYAKLAPDLNVMAFVTDIVPASILNYPRLGTIQYHPSLLPRHRGGSAINWAIIQGETRTGISIFWPDAGIDTGPILLQKEADISPNDTLGSLYYNKLFPLGIEALMEAVELVRQGKAPKIPQDESKATYEGLCREDQALVDWANPVSEVYNLIRGTDPQPGATTFVRGSKLKIYDSELLLQTSTKAPGEIVAIDSRGIVVTCRGGCILIKRVQIPGKPKTVASDYANSGAIKVGERLGR